MTTLLDFEEPFDPLYGASIVLPPHCVMFRGYDTRYPPISDWPSHYSSINVAKAYGTGPNKTLAAFTNTQPLRILDFRYLKVLLGNLFQNRPDNDEATLDPIIRTSIGYGMCDIVDQIQLGSRMFVNSPGIKALTNYYQQHILNKSYTEKPLDVNPVSTSGFRIAETQNDAYILQFLKQCMGHMVDGFIAPRLKSPYHVEKQSTMSPELVIFNPVTAGIKQIEMPALALPKMPSMTMNTILNLQTNRIEIKYKNIGMAHRGMRRGGNKNNSNTNDAELAASDETFQNAFIQKHKQDADLLQSAQKAGNKWKKQFTYIDYYTQHPECDLQPWQGQE